MDKELLTTLGSIVMDAAGNRQVQRVVLGTYTDGSTRNLFDAASGEFLSPKDREKYFMKRAEEDVFVIREVHPDDTDDTDTLTQDSVAP